MSESKERNFSVIESTKSETKPEIKSLEKTQRHTNPITKKLLEFQHQNAGKFSVRDLFRK